MTRTDAGRPANRYEEVDVYRGLAVVGVVFSHAVGGLRSAGLLPRDSLLWLTNDWLYQFRMPAIALVLGLFISYGVRKYGTKRYILKRAIFALYLYVLWYVIQMGMELATSSLKNHPITLAEALRIWSPPAHLWFIPYIAVSALVIAIVRPWERRPWLSLPLLIVGSTALWGWSPAIWGLQGLALVGFSAVGATIGVKRFGGFLRSRPGLVIVVGAISLGIALLFFGYQRFVPASVNASPELWVEGRLSWLPLSVFVAWLGQFILAGFAVALYRVPVVRETMVYVGQQTLPVYLAHILVIAGLRIVLMRLGIDSVPLLMVVLVVAGVAFPVLAERITQGNVLRHVFHPPDRWLPSPPARPALSSD